MTIRNTDDLGMFSTSFNNGVVRSTDGTLWMWGYNAYGGVGNNSTQPVSSPVQIGTDTNWSKVSLGQNTSFGIKQDGSLYAWGFNSGMFGNDSILDTSSPIQVSAELWNDVYVGASHVLGIDSFNKLWGWGLNDYGQLGNEDTSINTSSPIQIRPDLNFKKAYAQFKNSYALDTTDRLWVFGENAYGCLGVGDTIARSSPTQIVDNWFIDIAAGSNSANAIDMNGHRWATGDNNSGQLGLGDTVRRSSWTQSSGNVFWESIAAVASSYCGIETNLGKAWSWGFNAEGQLGDNTLIDKSSPIQVEPTWSWYKISGGQLGFTGLRAFDPRPTITPTVTPTQTVTPTPTSTPTPTPTPSATIGNCLQKLSHYNFVVTSTATESTGNNTFAVEGDNPECVFLANSALTYINAVLTYSDTDVEVTYNGTPTIYTAAQSPLTLSGLAINNTQNFIIMAVNYGSIIAESKLSFTLTCIPAPTATPTPTPSPSPSPSPTPSPSPSPTPLPTPTPPFFLYSWGQNAGAQADKNLPPNVPIVTPIDTDHNP